MGAGAGGAAVPSDRPAAAAKVAGVESLAAWLEEEEGPVEHDHQARSSSALPALRKQRPRPNSTGPAAATSRPAVALSAAREQPVGSSPGGRPASAQLPVGQPPRIGASDPAPSPRPTAPSSLPQQRQQRQPAAATTSTTDAAPRQKQAPQQQAPSVRAPPQQQRRPLQATAASITVTSATSPQRLPRPLQQATTTSSTTTTATSAPPQHPASTSPPPQAPPRPSPKRKLRLPHVRRSVWSLAARLALQQQQQQQPTAGAAADDDGHSGLSVGYRLLLQLSLYRPQGLDHAAQALRLRGAVAAQVQHRALCLPALRAASSALSHTRVGSRAFAAAQGGGATRSTATRRGPLALRAQAAALLTDSQWEALLRDLQQQSQDAPSGPVAQEERRRRRAAAPAVERLSLQQLCFTLAALAAARRPCPAWLLARLRQACLARARRLNGHLAACVADWHRLQQLEADGRAPAGAAASALAGQLQVRLWFREVALLRLAARLPVAHKWGAVAMGTAAVGRRAGRSLRVLPSDARS